MTPMIQTLAAPPTNLQAEQALLGALLANNRAYERVSEYLSQLHFADPIHGHIFQAIGQRIVAGQVADTDTLTAEFDHSSALKEVGGTPYLTLLLSLAANTGDVVGYGRVILDAWQRRQLIDIAEAVVADAFGDVSGLDGAAQISAAIQRLAGLPVARPM